MRLIRPLLILGLAVLAPVASGTAATLDYQGMAWETGGFPPSTPGDTLWMPIIVDVFDPLGYDPATEEITAFVGGLVSNGTQDAGDGILVTTYSPGLMQVFRDPARDHEFGENPLNATVPGTFVNGTLCLQGAIQDFVLYFDPESGTGAYEGTVSFTDGACLGELGAAQVDGFTFGGVFTRTALPGLPAGYDFSFDGFLEAEKVVQPGCPFDCIALTYARLDFPRHTRKHFGPKDGKFIIEGVFDPCDSFGDLVPSDHELQVRIGDFQLVLAPGALRRDRDDDDDDTEYEFKNSRGVATLTQVEIERGRGGIWEFELEGRGIPRQTLLGDGKRLEVEIRIGNMNGTATGTLVQKRDRLRLKGKDGACGCRDDDDVQYQLPVKPEIAAWGLQPATPNPFNATTTIALRAPEPGPARVRIFDVKGRLVRELHHGAISQGETRFTWDGRSEAGSAVASGVYIYRVEAPGIAENRKMVLAK